MFQQSAFWSARRSWWRPGCSCSCAKRGCNGGQVTANKSPLNKPSLNQFRDPVDDRFRRGIGLLDQRFELLAVGRIEVQFAQISFGDEIRVLHGRGESV